MGRHKTQDDPFTWKVPRPAYMRESEPLAHPDAWPSHAPVFRVDKEEQERNWRIFVHGKRSAGRVSHEQEQRKKAG
jgi:hypothetical protein